MNLVYRVEGIPAGFDNMSLAEKLNYTRIKKAFIDNAQVHYVGCKGKPSLKTVKQYIKDNKLVQYWAYWQTDSLFYKDDVVELYATRSGG